MSQTSEDRCDCGSRFHRLVIVTQVLQWECLSQTSEQRGGSVCQKLVVTDVAVEMHIVG